MWQGLPFQQALKKLYLSPVLDGFNSEIIAYNLSTSLNLAQVKMMLEQAFTEGNYENTILHSDQGCNINMISIIIFRGQENPTVHVT